MIVEAIVLAITNILNYAMGLLPSAENTSSISAAMSAAGTYFAKANTFLPIDTLFAIISLIILIEAGFITFKLVNFTIKKIRGSG